MPVFVQTAVNHPAPLPVQWLPGPTASIQTPVASVQMRHRSNRHRAGTGCDALRDTLGSGAERRSAGWARHRRRTTTAPRLFSLAFPARSDRGRGDTTRATTGTAPSAAVSAAQIATLAPPAPAVAAGERAKAQEQRPATQARPILPEGAGIAAVSYSSVGPLGAGGSDRTLLLIFLFLSRSSSLSPMPLGVSPRSGKPRPRTPALGAKSRASPLLLQFSVAREAAARQTLWKEKGLMKRILAVVAAMLGLLVSAGYASATPPGDPAAQALGQAAASGQAAGALSGASQSQPANQNISVRVLSPGNGGNVRNRTPPARTPRQGTRTSPASRPARPRTARADARAERKL